MQCAWNSAYFTADWVDFVPLKLSIVAVAQTQLPLEIAAKFSYEILTFSAADKFLLLLVSLIGMDSNEESCSFCLWSRFIQIRIFIGSSLTACLHEVQVLRVHVLSLLFLFHWRTEISTLIHWRAEYSVHSTGLFEVFCSRFIIRIWISSFFFVMEIKSLNHHRVPYI